MPSGFQQIGSEVRFSIGGELGNLVQLFLDWVWSWGQLGGGFCAGAGVGDGGLAIYIQPRQPVTVKFQSRQETEWVRETLYMPRLRDWILRNPELVSYPTVRCIG